MSHISSFHHAAPSSSSSGKDWGEKGGRGDTGGGERKQKPTVSLSAKISLMLKMLREMWATGSPPKVTLAERSYQVPRTSSSTCLPSASFVKVTVDSLVRTVGGLVRGQGARHRFLNKGGNEGMKGGASSVLRR